MKHALFKIMRVSFYSENLRIFRAQTWSIKVVSILVNKNENVIAHCES